MKQIYTLTTAILLVVAMISLASASGVVIPYFKDNTFKVYPGDVTGVSFSLQNGGGATKAVTFKASIIDGSEIATLDSDTFVVPAGASVPVTLNINIPSTAAVGTKYPLKLSFVTVTSGVGTGVNIGTGMEASLNVLVESAPVVEQPAPVMSNTAWISIAVIIIVIILWIILRKKPAKRRK